MTTIIAQALGLLLAVAPPTGAAPAASDAYIKCVDSTSTNLEWAGCGEAYLKRLDGELNAAWKDAFRSLDEQSRKQLLDEQRTWLKFRDSSCQFWANGSYGREGQVLHFYGCRSSIIEARIADLKGIYGLMHQDEQ